MKAGLKGLILILLFLGLMSGMDAWAQDSIPDGLKGSKFLRTIDSPPNTDPWPPYREEPLESHLRGIWAHPDCAMAENMFVFSEHFIMKAWPGLYYIGPIRAVREEAKDDGDTLVHLQSLRYSLVVRITNDGLLKTFEAPILPDQPLYLKWSSQQETLTDEYTRCAKLFGTKLPLKQEEVNTPYILDMIAKACRTLEKKDFPQAETCHRAIFNVADYNQDNVLDANELARAYRQIVFMNSATIHLCNQTETYTEETRGDAALFARDLLSTLAAEGKNTISYNELVAFLRDTSRHHGQVYKAIDYARGLQGLMPYLPDPDESRACNPHWPDSLQTLGTIEGAPVEKKSP